MGQLRKGKYRYEISVTPEVNKMLTEYADDICVSVPTYIQIILKRHIKEMEAKNQND